MTLVQEAFTRLWPEKEFSYSVFEEYNRRLGPFNANISLSGKQLGFKYNLQWKKVDDEIQIGLIQHLLIKMLARKGFERKRTTYNIKLYNNFCKQIPTYVSEDHDLDSNCDSLKESFERVNKQFFGGDLSECKLSWGNKAVRRLASYNFNSDSITVSSIFRESPQHVLDLLMYHEMLHKDLQFDCKNGRVRTHTPVFKHRENLYPQKEVVEKEIDGIIRSVRREKGLYRQTRRKSALKNSMFKRIQDFF